MKFYPLNLLIIVISIVYTVLALNKSDCCLAYEWEGFETTNDDNKCCEIGPDPFVCNALHRITDIFM